MKLDVEKIVKKLFLIIFIFGLAAMFIGLAYGCIAVGVPKQDPPPSIVARQVANSKISGLIMIIGIAISFLGSIILGLCYMICKIVKSIINYHMFRSHEIE